MGKFRLIFIMLTSIALFGAEKLSLQECIDLALTKNPDIALSQQDVRAYQAGIPGSYGSILPYLSANVSSSRGSYAPSEYYDEAGRKVTIPTQTTESYGAGVSYYQNIFDGGKWWNYIRLAKSQLDNAMINSDYTRQLIIANVTEKFYNVLKAQELLKVYEETLENSREQLLKTQEMHKIGQVAKKDLFKAQVREGNDRLAVIRQKSILKSNIAQLNVAIGQSPETKISVYEKDYRNPEKVDPETAIATALKNNKIYNSLKLQQQTALINYKIARADFFPTLSTSFSYNRNGTQFNDIYNNFDRSWTTYLSFNISYPIFNGFQRRTNVQRQRLNYQSFDNQIRKQRIDIENQIQSLILELETYREMIAINELNIKSAKEDLRLAQEMYNLKSATFLEVLDAQVAFTTAQQQLINTKYDAKIAEIKLAVAMGTL